MFYIFAYKTTIIYLVIKYIFKIEEEKNVMKEYNPEVKIIIATHKKYRMPDDSMYLPLHVGAEGKKDENGNPLDLGYEKDNTGDNISLKNPNYCELTGLYWAWKNLEVDFIGLAHYRRHFGRKGREPFEGILTYKQLKPLLSKYKVFVPTKRRYYIETLYSHYKHTHYAEQLDLTRKIISEKYPDYIESYDEVIKHTYGYMFNMCIMQKKYFDAYCRWLFDILFELEQRIGTLELSDFQGRFYGRVSEIIFNVWLSRQIKSGILKRSEIKELSYKHIEKINWYKKGTAFLRAKFFNRKYEGSF